MTPAILHQFNRTRWMAGVIFSLCEQHSDRVSAWRAQARQRHHNPPRLQALAERAKELVRQGRLRRAANTLKDIDALARREALSTKRMQELYSQLFPEANEMDDLSSVDPGDPDLLCITRDAAKEILRSLDVGSAAGETPTYRTPTRASRSLSFHIFLRITESSVWC